MNYNPILFKKIAVLLICSSLHSQAELKRLKGNFTFRGEIEKKVFQGEGFSIHEDGEKLKVVLGDEKFTFISDFLSVRDFVKSDTGGAFCALLKEDDTKSPRGYRVLTMNNLGGSFEFSFKGYDFIEGFDWIVELGAVSQNGSYILAKCATFMPAKEGTEIRNVNHSWAILKFTPDSLQVVESRSGIERWARYKGN